MQIHLFLCVFVLFYFLPGAEKLYQRNASTHMCWYMRLNIFSVCYFSDNAIDNYNAEWQNDQSNVNSPLTCGFRHFDIFGAAKRPMLCVREPLTSRVPIVLINTSPLQGYTNWSLNTKKNHHSDTGLTFPRKTHFRHAERCERENWHVRQNSPYSALV